MEPPCSETVYLWTADVLSRGKLLSSCPTSELLIIRASCWQWLETLMMESARLFVWSNKTYFMFLLCQFLNHPLHQCFQRWLGRQKFIGEAFPHHCTIILREVSPAEFLPKHKKKNSSLSHTHTHIHKCWWFFGAVNQRPKQRLPVCSPFSTFSVFSLCVVLCLIPEGAWPVFFSHLDTTKPQP